MAIVKSIKRANRYVYLSVLLVCIRVKRVITSGFMYCCKSSLCTRGTVSVAVHSKKNECKFHERFNVQNHALDQLKAPSIVDFRWDQPLLHDGQYRRNLSRREHLRSISTKECLEQFDQAGDTSFLLPYCRGEEEREKASIIGRNFTSRMEVEHLCEDLKYVGDIF